MSGPADKAFWSKTESFTIAGLRGPNCLLFYHRIYVTDRLFNSKIGPYRLLNGMSMQSVIATLSSRDDYIYISH